MPFTRNNWTFEFEQLLYSTLVSTGGGNSDKDEWPLSGMAVMEAPLYQSYVVSLLSRVRPKTGIHLGNVLMNYLNQ